MRKLFYVLAVVCLVGWSVSVFVYAATELIHSLLAFVVIFFTLAIMKDEKAIASPAEQDYII
ncbi:lmo0937 family membrane protein [Mucilaginibacter sp. Bleaf8]|uniref:lmo0937 family membrane protein n=1 Tax=Mucilaginibacter sp. Bleaf8 TaxID=2834430 RepID=UPI001BCE4502|nr:lmo0937 family membrane protein [Mucilaginibacter sp. Bleaf8]MBS7565830.1 lmo0937 family membrane protein [Mucilaginibacter sp. Bleaf8]